MCIAWIAAVECTTTSAKLKRATTPEIATLAFSIAKIREESTIQQQEAAKYSKRKLAQNQKRIAELDRLFKKTYEDNASGKLSDKLFEQLTAEIAAFNEDSEKSSRFIELVRRYTEYDELTTPILNSFINKIVVHEADKSSGERVQDVDVYFNFIGRFTPPQEEHIPTEEELAEAEKRRQRLARQREANQRWYAKKREEEKRRLAIEAGEIPPPSAEEIETAELERLAAEEIAEAERRERRQRLARQREANQRWYAKKREYQRNWARQKSAKRKAAQAATA